jgi:hypothetical protein
VIVSAQGSAAAVAAALRAAGGTKGRARDRTRAYLLHNVAALAANCATIPGGDRWTIELAAPRHGALRALVKAARAGPAAFPAPGGNPRADVLLVDPVVLGAHVACVLGAIAYSLRDPIDAATAAPAAARDAAAAVLPPDAELRALVWGGLAAGGREGLACARAVALRSRAARYDLAATPGVLAWLAAAAIDGAGVPGPAGSTSGSALQLLHTLSGGRPGQPPERGCVPCTDAGCVDPNCSMNFRAPNAAVARERAALGLQAIARFAVAGEDDGNDAMPAANAAAALEALQAGRLRGGVASGLGGGAGAAAGAPVAPVLARQKAKASCAACGADQAQDGLKFKKCGACGIPR